jgi:hypothetical protein
MNALKNQSHHFVRSNASLKVDEIKLIIATYHVLFCNEAAIQVVYDFISSVKRSNLYEREIKRRINEIDHVTTAYRRKLNNTFMLDKGKRKPENIRIFADMNDNFDEVTLPVIEKTRLAIRLALSKSIDKAVGEGKMTAERVDLDVLSNAVLASDLCHIATEVHKAELIRAQNLCGGVINNIHPYNLKQLEGLCKTFSRVICNEMRIDGVRISEDPEITAWIKDLCKKACNIQTIINAMETHSEEVES